MEQNTTTRKQTKKQNNTNTNKNNRHNQPNTKQQTNNTTTTTPTKHTTTRTTTRTNNNDNGKNNITNQKIENKKTEIKQRNQRLNALFKKHKGLIFKYKRTVNFKEPVALLLRRTGTIEFYEQVNQSEFQFEHTDGKEYKIYLAPRYLHTFEYGNTTFKGYILHEDSAYPLPTDPIHSTQMINAVIDKTLNDIKSWKAKELEAKGKLWWSILIGIAIIGLVYVLYKLMVPTPPTTTEIATQQAILGQALQTMNIT